MRYMVVVALGLALLLTLGLLGVIRSKRTIEIQLTKTSYFESVKHRVTSDMLKEFQANVAEANMRLEQAKKQVADLLPEVKTAQEVADGKTAELNTCNSELNQMKEDITGAEAEKNKTELEFQKNKASLQEQINNLKAETEKRSNMCDYIIKSSVEGMKLCGIVVVLQPEQKAVAPKAN